MAETELTRPARALVCQARRLSARQVSVLYRCLIFVILTVCVWNFTKFSGLF